MRYLSIFCLCTLLWTCKTGEIDYPVTGGDIKIYIAVPMTGEQARTTDFNDWILEDTPWVDAHEIEFYDWSAQMFYLRRNKEREKFAGSFFVVTSNEKRLFSGMFVSIFSSYIPPSPSILAYDHFFYPLNLIQLGGFYRLSNLETHKSEAFRDALIQAGLLREGIAVDLLNIQKYGTSSVVYTYKVTNLDKETLLIPDPDKMGAERFHYITNGVSLSGNNTYYSAENMTHTSFESFDDSWYYPLNSGESMTWHVLQDGFKVLPKGNYTGRFTFPGQINRNTHWQQQNGRIWVGSISVQNSINI
jgi:hypothetical protein